MTTPAQKGAHTQMAILTRVRIARGVSQTAADVMTAATFKEAFERIVANASLVIKGTENALRLVLTAMIADGPCLLADMPGTGKTRMARALQTAMASMQVPA